MIYGLLESAAKIAPLGTFLIALTAIIIAYNQLKTARANEAKKQYFSYLDECMKYPKLAAGVFNDDEKLAYLWFLTKAFTAHESIYEEFYNDEHWKLSAKLHLRPHIINIMVLSLDMKNKIGFESYSKKFQELLTAISNEIESEAIKQKGSSDES